MSAISAGLVKELRERTGLGMMECKKALVEANGDIDAAIEELRKSSGMKAAKKASRVAADGIVLAKVADDFSYGVLVEVNSETDFVARDENFKGFALKVLDKAFTGKQTDVAALMAGELEVAREALVQKIGENIGVRRVSGAEGDVVNVYVHGTGRIAVLVNLKGGDADLAKDVAMHVAASNPQYLSPADFSQDVIAKEREIYIAQAADSGKPQEIIEKMVEGRVRKFMQEHSLTEQPFVKDPEITVGKLVKNAGATIVSFIRFEVGEGIDKEETDFAAEVAALKGA
jgi:elongation factor Ts